MSTEEINLTNNIEGTDGGNWAASGTEISGESRGSLGTDGASRSNSGADGVLRGHEAVGSSRAAAGSGTLYLCATPIGNLGDITERVLRTLEEVDLIAAEDTRNTLRLLNHFEIKKPLTSYHEYNKYTKADELIAKLQRGANIAVVTDAVSVGVIPDDMDAMAKESLEYRFPTCNDYFLYSRAVKSAMGQIQKDLNTYAENKTSVPVLGQLISLSKIFVGLALGFTYDLILGYTFWRDGKTLYTSAADGVAIFHNCWKRIATGVLFVALYIIVGMSVAFLFMGAIGAAMLAPTYGPLAGGLAGVAIGYFVCSAAKAFIDSRLMITIMTPFFEEAQYAEITEEEYGTLYKNYTKYAKLYQKGQSEGSGNPAA